MDDGQLWRLFIDYGSIVFLAAFGLFIGGFVWLIIALTKRSNRPQA